MPVRRRPGGRPGTRCRPAAQRVAVDQEQHPLGPGVLEQAVDEVAGCEGLAAAGRHLDQRAWPIVGERLLEPADRLRPGSRAGRRSSSGGMARSRRPQRVGPPSTTRAGLRAGGTRTDAVSGARDRARRGRTSRRPCSRKRRAADRPTWRDRPAARGCTGWSVPRRRRAWCRPSSPRSHRQPCLPRTGDSRSSRRRAAAHAAPRRGQRGDRTDRGPGASSPRP